MDTTPRVVLSTFTLAYSSSLATAFLCFFSSLSWSNWSLVWEILWGEKSKKKICLYLLGKNWMFEFKFKSHFFYLVHLSFYCWYCSASQFLLFSASQFLLFIADNQETSLLVNRTSEILPTGSWVKRNWSKENWR